MGDDGTEHVPGMAEAIEQRRIERGLTPGQFTEAAGLTRQGLLAVREGRRKQYQDKVKIGVANALGWQPDAIDRLLAGQPPLEISPAGDVIAMIKQLADQIHALRDDVTKLSDQIRNPAAHELGRESQR